MALYAIKRVYEYDELDVKAQETAINDQIQFMLEVEQDSDIVQNAINKAEENDTPWFAGQILFEDNEDAIMDIVRRSYYDGSGYFVQPEQVHDLNLE